MNTQPNQFINGPHPISPSVRGRTKRRVRSRRHYTRRDRQHVAGVRRAGPAAQAAGPPRVVPRPRHARRHSVDHLSVLETRAPMSRRGRRPRGATAGG